MTTDDRHTKQMRLMPFWVGVLGAAFVLIGAFAAFGQDFGISGKASWFGFVAGVALLNFAVSARQKATAFGAVAATMMIGAAAELGLTNGNFFPAVTLKLWEGVNPIFSAFLALQAIVALWSLNRHREDARNIVMQIGAGRIIAYIILASAFIAPLMGYLGQGRLLAYAAQSIFGSAVLCLNLLSLLALCLERKPKYLQKIPSPVGLALAAGISAALMSWLAFEFTPHVEDELAYLFHAKTFLGGAIHAPAPPIALQPAFEYYLLNVEGDRWYSTTTPGWSGFVALGLVLGEPWLLNAILLAFCVLLMFALVARLTSSTTARFAALFVVASPWIIESAGPLMPHIAALMTTLFAWWLLSAPKSGHFAHLGAGLAMGLLFTNRQLEAIILGTITGAVLVLRIASWRQLSFVALYSIGAIATGSLYLIYNAAMTGDPLLPPLQPYLEALWHHGANAYGFGENRGPTPKWGQLDFAEGHSLAEGAINTIQGIFSVQYELFGWAFGSLILVFAHLFFGRQSKIDVIAWVIIFAIIGVHVFYWFSGTFYIGARYWFGIAAPVIYLSARGISSLIQRFDLSPSAITPVILVLCMISAGTFTTWRAVEKYHGYGSYTGDLRQMRESFGNAIVIFEGSADIGSALFMNDPWFGPENPIFVNGAHISNLDDLRAAFPNRDIKYWPARD